MLVKPIMHLFTGETKNKYYRHFLSTVENHRKYPVFSEFVEVCIAGFEKANTKAMNRRPNDKCELVQEEE